jgi:hypothetical protein
MGRSSWDVPLGYQKMESYLKAVPSCSSSNGVEAGIGVPLSFLRRHLPLFNFHLSDRQTDR